MYTLRNLLSTAVLATALGYSYQAAADIVLTATDGLSTVTVDDHATPGLAAFSGAIGNFTISIDLGAGFPAVGSSSHPILDLTSLDLTTGTVGGALTIFLTETDFATGAGVLDFKSRIVGNYFNSTATMSTYLDATNAHFGTGTMLSSGLLDNQSGAVSAAVGAGLFSLTEIVTVTAGANSLASVDAAIMVPEPQSSVPARRGLARAGHHGFIFDRWSIAACPLAIEEEAARRVDGRGWRPGPAARNSGELSLAVSLSTPLDPPLGQKEAQHAQHPP